MPVFDGLGTLRSPTSAPTSQSGASPQIRQAAEIPDAVFEHPRLVAIYDALDADRSDLDLYVAMAEDLGARRVLDLGCGTGTFALLLAGQGREVVAVDPAGGSLRFARTKAGAERVRRIHGDVTALPPLQVDLATMTANVAQAITDRADWDRTLRGVYGAFHPGGRLVFETRDPAHRAWRRWTRAASYRSPKSRMWARSRAGSSSPT